MSDQSLRMFKFTSKWHLSNINTAVLEIANKRQCRIVNCSSVSCTLLGVFTRYQYKITVTGKESDIEMIEGDLSAIFQEIKEKHNDTKPSLWSKLKGLIS